ncbi:uncharacterized protein LOC114362135 [Ostrinia furnacalis]|uniref:uncharacterized protein LOC114362135 n=1 Tax=Ostrinia furnacalis TaxID=93504 RepID=UPI00103EA1DC|nr:uncharacterized protein LOC114362135 [Ostrinia furnacalis]
MEVRKTLWRRRRRTGTLWRCRFLQAFLEDEVRGEEGAAPAALDFSWPPPDFTPSVEPSSPVVQMLPAVPVLQPAVPEPAVLVFRHNPSNGDCGEKSRIEEYWNCSRDIFSTPEFSTAMSCDRFLLLSRCLYFQDNAICNPGELTRAQAKLFKIQPIVDHLNLKFSHLYTLDRNVAA